MLLLYALPPGVLAAATAGAAPPLAAAALTATLTAVQYLTVGCPLWTPSGSAKVRPGGGGAAATAAAATVSGRGDSGGIPVIGGPSAAPSPLLPAVVPTADAVAAPRAVPPQAGPR